MAAVRVGIGAALGAVLCGPVCAFGGAALASTFVGEAAERATRKHGKRAIAKARKHLASKGR